MRGDTDLTDGERVEIGAMWAFRAAGEHETAAHYDDLARRLQAHGAAETAERIAAASWDESRHRDVCIEQAARAGHRLAPFARAKPRRIAPHDLGEEARLCYEVVALTCVTESINATLLLRSWQRAQDMGTRATLHALLTDEVQHSRIGWGYLAAQAAFKDEIGARVPRMLAAAVHDEHFLVEPASVESPALAAHGLLSQADRRAVFLEAMHDVVLPGLELCRVPTVEARRWLDACTARWS
jgi:hypothetical protein